MAPHLSTVQKYTVSLPRTGTSSPALTRDAASTGTTCSEIATLRAELLAVL